MEMSENSVQDLSSLELFIRLILNSQPDEEFMEVECLHCVLWHFNKIFLQAEGGFFIFFQWDTEGRALLDSQIQ